MIPMVLRLCQCGSLLAVLVLVAPGCADVPVKKDNGNNGMPIFHRSGEPLYLTAMGRSQPQSALTIKEKRFAWRLIDYETEDFKGKLMFAGEETQAPDVSYPLETEGWHDVFVGMFNTAWRPYQDQQVRAKLSDDKTFSNLFLPKPTSLPWGVPEDDTERGPRIQEVYFKTADLSGQSLTFQQPCQLVVPEDQEFGSICEKVWIAYIKLVPLSQKEVQALQADREQTETKRLFGYNDSWGVAWGRSSPATAEFVQSHLEPYRHTDFKRIYWDGVHGDVCNYFTKIGRTWTREHYDLADYVRVGDRLLVETWTEYKEKGIDPFQVAADYAHEVGLEFHANYRLGWGPFYWPPPWQGFNQGGFWEKHPEWRCVRRDGTPGTAMSFAFPGVRSYMLSIVAEMASYPIDGVAILYNRQPPYVDYEAPLVEGFKAEYGEDPRDLEERDVRWLSYRSKAATLFMRELRDTLEKAAVEQGRSQPYEISAWVFGSLEENLYYGLDVRTWVEEGLIDTIIPYSSAEKLFSWQMAWENAADVKQWTTLTRDTSTTLALNVMPRNLPVRDYRRKAQALYQSGVEHLAFWDTVIWSSASSLALRRLGHKGEISAWIDAEEVPEQLPFSRLRRLGDWDLGFFPE